MSSIKSLIVITAVLLYLVACKESTAQTRNDVTIAKGQMPAMVKDRNNTLHMVFGSGDSLMYMYSTNNGLTFSTPALIKQLPHVYTYATRGPQIAATGNGILVIACTTAGNIYSFTKFGEKQLATANQSK